MAQKWKEIYDFFYLKKNNEFLDLIYVFLRFGFGVLYYRSNAGKRHRTQTSVLLRYKYFSTTLGFFTRKHMTPWQFKGVADDNSLPVKISSHQAHLMYCLR